MNYAPTKRILFIVLILVLLVHIIMFFPIFLQNLEKAKAYLTSTPQEQPSTQQEESFQQWASRKPRASNFGAPVIFQQDDSSEQQAQEEVKEETPQEQHTPAEQFEATTQEQEPTPEQPTAQEQQQEEQPAAQPEAPKVKPEPAPSTTFEPKELAEPKPIEIKKPVAPAAKPVAVKKPQQKSMPKPPPQKEPFNLTKLAQGFLHYAKNEGNDVVEIRGDDNALPTDEQIKHERYWQKIAWCIQNSSRINSHIWRSIPATTRASTYWYMVLNKQGQIKELALQQSSGDRELDRVIQLVIQDASSSFPPVPNYFAGDQYAMRYTLYLEPPQPGNYRFAVR